MGFLQYDQNGAWATDSGPVDFTSESYLQQKLKHYSDRRIRRYCGDSTEIEYRDCAILSEPRLDDAYQRVGIARANFRLPLEPQPRVQKAEP